MSQSRTAEDFSAEEVEGWKGENVYDKEKSKLGHIEDIYLSAEKPRWAVIKMGAINTSEVFAPLKGAFRTNDGIHLDFEIDKIKEAPTVEPKGGLDAGGEEQLTAYYGLEEEKSSGGEKNDQPDEDEMPIPEPAEPEEEGSRDDGSKSDDSKEEGAEGSDSNGDDSDGDESGDGDKREASKKLALEDLATQSTAEVEETLKEGTVVEVPKTESNEPDQT